MAFLIFEGFDDPPHWSLDQERKLILGLILFHYNLEREAVKWSDTFFRGE